MKCKQVKLTDIADVNRVRKDDILPKGTLYIRVSACKGEEYEQWNIMKEDGNPGDEFAALTLKREAIPEYLKEALERVAPHFMHRYVGKNINISMDLFSFYRLDFHEDLEEQRRIVRVMSTINDEIEMVKRQIKEHKQVKEWNLRHMFPEA